MKLKIRNWSKLFENAESRKLNSLKWVAMPNRMHGQGYTALVDHPNGAAHFGAWCAIVEIASAREKKEERGQLPEADGTIGGISRSLGRISRLSGGIFEELLPRLIYDPEIMWIQDLTVESGENPDAPGKSPDAPGRKGRGGEGTEGKGTGGEGKKPPTPAPVATMPQPIDFEERYLAIYDKHVTIGWIQDGRYEYTKAISNGAQPPEKIADVIDAAHAEWMAFFNENPSEYRPGIGKWLKEGYWMRRPKAREPTAGGSRTQAELLADRQRKAVDEALRS